MPGPRPRRVIIRRPADPTEQSLVHRFQHIRIPHGGDQQRPFPLDPQQIARGAVGQTNASAGDIVMVKGSNGSKASLVAKALAELQTASSSFDAPRATR